MCGTPLLCLASPPWATQPPFNAAQVSFSPLRPVGLPSWTQSSQPDPGCYGSPWSLLHLCLGQGATGRLAGEGSPAASKTLAAAQSCPLGVRRQRAPSHNLVMKGLQIPAVLLGKGKLLMLSTVSSSSPPSQVLSVPKTLWQSLTTRTLADETCWLGSRGALPCVLLQSWRITCAIKEKEREISVLCKTLYGKSGKLKPDLFFFLKKGLLGGYIPLGDGDTTPDVRGKGSELPCDGRDYSSHTVTRGHKETLLHRATSFCVLSQRHSETLSGLEAASSERWTRVIS